MKILASLVFLAAVAPSYAQNQRPTSKELQEFIKSTLPYRHQSHRRAHGQGAHRSFSAGIAAAPSPTPVPIKSGGALSPLEAFYDVQSYVIALKVDPTRKSISGYTDIEVLTSSPQNAIRFDLVNNYTISRISLLMTPTDMRSQILTDFTHADDMIVIQTPMTKAGHYTFRIEYAGIPTEAIDPPWEGGFTWSRTEQNEPWIGISCEGEGSKIWFPSKDHPSDEPEKVRLEITVPSGLYVAATGLLQSVTQTEPAWTTFVWETHYPTNNYGINFTAGTFDLTQSEFDFEGTRVPAIFYGLKQAQSIDLIDGDTRTLAEKKSELLSQGIEYLEFFSRNFGMYPWANEKMAYIQTPYLGMEHQTGIAYGYDFKSQFGMDFIAFHELAHEWFGNKLTAKDWADIWLHEGFATYSEALYMEEKFDNTTYWRYLNNLKATIDNQAPVVSKVESSSAQLDVVDIYEKGANILAIFRELVGRDAFLAIIREFLATPPGVPAKFATTEDFLQTIENRLHRSYRWFFDVYLTRAELPMLKHRRQGTTLTLRWDVSTPFPLPVPVEFIDAGLRRKIVVPMTGNTGSIEIGTGQNLTIAGKYSRMIRQSEE